MKRMSQEHGKMCVMAIHHVEWNAEFILLTMHQTSVKLVLTVQKTMAHVAAPALSDLCLHALFFARAPSRPLPFFLGAPPFSSVSLPHLVA